MQPDKFILDACAGFRMMWFDKNHPNTVYIDLLDDIELSKKHRDYEKQRNRKGSNWLPQVPTIKMDFRKLDYPDESFKLIVWDPPHLSTITKTSLFYKKFGSLNAETWPQDIKGAARELWRVLQPYGILVFKWSNSEIGFRTILKLFPVKPLFGNYSTSHGSKHKTAWICFMKIPNLQS